MDGGGETADWHQVGGLHQHIDDKTFIRSRLVAEDFLEKGGERDDVFGAMPPLDRLKSMHALSFREDSKVVVVDVRTSYVNRVVKPEDLRLGPRRAKCAGELRNVACSKGVC